MSQPATLSPAAAAAARGTIVAIRRIGRRTVAARSQYRAVYHETEPYLRAAAALVTLVQLLRRRAVRTPDPCATPVRAHRAA